MRESLITQIYENPIPESAAIGFIRVQCASQPMRMERHDNCYELLYMQSGEKLLTVDGRDYPLRGGDMLIIRPGESHGNLGTVQNRSALCYILLCDPGGKARFLNLNAGQRREIAQRLAETRLIRAGTELRRVMERVEGCLERDDALAKPRLTALLLLLLDELVNGGAAEETPPPEIERAARFVDEHPAQLLSVGELAEIAGLSEARFKYQFKRFMGVPPAEYALRARVRLAERMLREGSGVARTAAQLGFSSAQHFSKVFKRYQGLSPSAYKNQRE